MNNTDRKDTRLRISFEKNSEEIREKLEKLKKIYEVKTNNALLEKLIDAELRRQWLQ